MNLEQQREAIQVFTKKMIETIASKGDDYADEDRLSNFKDVAYITGLTPEMICFVLMAVKIVRLKQLLSGKTPKNEPMKDSLLDLSDYSFLLDCILDEKQKPKINELDVNVYDDYNGIVPLGQVMECKECKKQMVKYLYKSRDNNIFCDRACFERHDGKIDDY